MALVHMGHKTRDLKRNLRRAVVDHVSDAFLDTRVPLLLLIDAASKGDREGVSVHGDMFLAHAGKLVEVSGLACAMSSDQDGVKMVRYAALQVCSSLSPSIST